MQDSEDGQFNTMTLPLKANAMPEVITMLVQALPVGWYADSQDGKLPIEQVIIKDLIPHIDATYRTISTTQKPFEWNLPRQECSGSFKAFLV